MDLGLYIAATGMVAEQVRQDQLSNDLANASTPGYKPDESPQHSFGAGAAGEHRGRDGGRLGQPGASRWARRSPTSTQGSMQETRRTARLRARGQRLLRGQDRPGRALHARRAVHGLRAGRADRLAAATRCSGQGGAQIKVAADRHRAAERAGRLRSPGRGQAGRKPLHRRAVRQGRRRLCARARSRAPASTPPR